MKEKMKGKKGSLVQAVASLLVLILSLTVLAPMMSKPETYQKTLEELDEKQKIVMEVAGTATTSSIVLAAIPDDATTPVANKIMDLAGYLVIVLCAIILEKYMLTIFGYLAFTWLIPIACGIFFITAWWRNFTLNKMAIKLAILGIAMWAVVPLSVTVSNMIEDTYHLSIEASRDSESETEGTTVAQTEATVAETQAVETTEAEGGSWFDRAWGSISDKLTDAKNTSQELINSAADLAKNAVDSVGNITEEAIKKAKDMFWDLVETVVVLIVTNCVLPVLVLLFMLWAVNLIMGVQIAPPKFRAPRE